MSMKDILTDEKGQIIISIIWGLGLATLFRKVCKGRNCIVIKGPKPAEMDEGIYLFNSKCFKYTAENTQCNKE
jgi:hypothetical protein